MKKLFLIFCSLLFSFAHSQATKMYYLKIPFTVDVPEVIDNNDGTVTLISSNAGISNLFSQYTIISFRKAFANYKTPSLKITYLIVCDPTLIRRLTTEYTTVFPSARETHEPVELLTPDDYNPTIASTYYQLHDLDLVGAESAWDISTGDGVIVGIAETTNPSQEELAGKCETVYGSSFTGTTVGHGTSVAVIAAGNTDNTVGRASIGYNAKIKSGPGYDAMMFLALNGARVINMSWHNGSPSATYNPDPDEQDAIDEIYDLGVVLVAAAGNGTSSAISDYYYHYPASLDHVISVTNVGSQYTVGTPSVDQKFMKDIHENATPPYFVTHNDRVDISAPGRNILTAKPDNTDPLNLNIYATNGGTSLSAPLLTGTIALMFGINECLFPDEIESILKLTSFKNDVLPLNSLYQGIIGDGRLQADEAVIMAQQMALPYGTVDVKNRIVNRFYYVLKTNPYEIKLTNNLLTDGAIFDFSARDNIEIISGDYKPSSSGEVHLKIVPVNTVCNTAIPDPSPRALVNPQKNIKETRAIKLFPNPNKGTFTIAISKNSKDILVTIFDTFGKLVYSTTANGSSFDIDATHLPVGLYLVKLSSNDVNETLKFIKE